MANKSLKKNIVAIVVAASVAIPILCLPLGVRENNNSARLLRTAYAATHPEVIEEEEVLVEEWAITDENGNDMIFDISTGVLATESYFDGYSPTSYEDSYYSDVPSYTVYQAFDEADLPIELLDPMYFAPEENPNMIYYIRAQNSILKAEPDMSSMTVTTLAFGEGVNRISIGDTWSKIITEEGLEGYVISSTITDEMVWTPIDRTVWVDTGSLTLRAEPSTQAEVVATLPVHTRLRCTGVSDKWYEVTTDNGQQGYVYISYTTTNAPPTPTPVPNRTNTGTSGNRGNGGSTSNGGGGGGNSGYVAPVITGVNGESIVNICVSMLGVPYVFSGESTSGVDCSGLVVYAYRQVGVYGIPHLADSIRYSGQSVDRANIRVGDVVCYGNGSYCSHVGIYVGGGQVIHASNSRGNVRYGNLDMMPILSIRRFIG